MIGCCGMSKCGVVLDLESIFKLLLDVLGCVALGRIVEYFINSKFTRMERL